MPSTHGTCRSPMADHGAYPRPARPGGLLPHPEGWERPPAGAGGCRRPATAGAARRGRHAGRRGRGFRLRRGAQWPGHPRLPRRGLAGTSSPAPPGRKPSRARGSASPCAASRASVAPWWPWAHRPAGTSRGPSSSSPGTTGRPGGWRRSPRPVAAPPRRARRPAHHARPDRLARYRARRHLDQHERPVLDAGVHVGITAADAGDQTWS